MYVFYVYKSIDAVFSNTTTPLDYTVLNIKTTVE
jgi:hypothetical protein